MTATSSLASTALVRRPLDSGWELTVGAGPAPDAIAVGAVPATVPGCVHTDLLAAGLIPDPFLDDNESALAWIGLVDWTYATTFAWTPDDADRTDLVFEGLDTVTTILLNGSEVGATANQHRSYRFDVRGALVEGENELVVRFRSPVKYANEQSVALGVRQRPYPLPYDAIRKSACSFGWDWGIATYTSGIVKPVGLESWSVARLAQTRVVGDPVDALHEHRLVVDDERERRAGIVGRHVPAHVSEAHLARRAIENRAVGGCDELHLDVVQRLRAVPGRPPALHLGEREHHGPS